MDISEGAAPALLRVMTILSPSFPVGAFSYSHGLEWAVETGDVHDCGTLLAWVGDVLEAGAGRTDGVLLAEAYRLTRRGDDEALRELVDLALALQPTAERLLEAEMQGRAFSRALAAGWPPDPDEGWLDALSLRAPYSVAVGIGGARLGLDLSILLPAALHAMVANLVSAGVRLVPLGQSDGVRALAALEPRIVGCAAWAASATVAEMGSFAPRIDIASFKHETQYTRLFRS